MFNDSYGLTKAVLEGRKTMTRRVIKAPRTMEGKDVYGYSVVKYPRTGVPIEVMALDADGAQINNILPKYKVGEVVAVAQNYKDVREGGYPVDSRYDAFREADWGIGVNGALKGSAGETNKMFVKADLMPHHVRITSVRVERLQDISDEDALREGIYKKTLCPPGDIDYFYHSEPRSKWDVYPSAREAFAGLIDNVSGKGTWASNPWVFVYEFELVK